MSQTQQAHGRWVRNGCSIVSERGEYIATVGAPSGRSDKDIDRAELIAAAPETAAKLAEVTKERDELKECWQHSDANVVRLTKLCEKILAQRDEFLAALKAVLFAQQHLLGQMDTYDLAAIEKANAAIANCKAEG